MRLSYFCPDFVFLLVSFPHLRFLLFQVVLFNVYLILTYLKASETVTEATAKTNTKKVSGSFKHYRMISKRTIETVSKNLMKSDFIGKKIGILY